MNQIKNNRPGLGHKPSLKTRHRSNPYLMRSGGFLFKTLITSCIFLILGTGFSEKVYAQNPAMIEIEGQSGILIPRLSTVQRESITNPVNGLLVYDSTLDQFFFYSSLAENWQGLSVEFLSAPTENGQVPHQPSFGADWNVRGNTGANLYTSDPPLLGTTDYSPLVFITNDQERLRITEDGTVTIAGDLDVGEDAIIGMDLTVKQDVFLNTEGGSTTINGPTTIGGAGMNLATFTGPVQMDKTLNVDGATTLNDILDVDGATTLNNSLDVGGATTVLNMNPTVLTGILSVDKDATFKQMVTLDNAALSSTSPATGALKVAGGVGIGENLNVGGTTNLNAQVTIDAAITGGAQEDYSQYPLRVEGGDHGIAVKVNGVTPDRNTNFMTFFDGAGDPMARIEGFRGFAGVIQTIANAIVPTSPAFDDVIGNSQDRTQAPANVPASAEQFFNSDYGIDLLSGALDFIDAIVRFAVNAIGASGLCVSGDCDDVIWSAVDVVVAGIQLAGVIVYNEFNLGASFESGGADYAEWLKKANIEEGMAFGDVVGLKGGLISKKYTDAEKFMVISNNPSVIGGMPQNGNEKNFEKIAFMGQVPVKVIGEVKKGDYIIPSGNGDGFAVAVAPDAMKTRDYQRIIGIAWDDSDGKKIFNYINTAVGINSNDMAGLIENMQAMMNDMQFAISKVNRDFIPRYYDIDKNVHGATTAYTQSPSLSNLAANDFNTSSYATLEEGMKPVLEFASSQDLNLDQYPYVVELLNDPKNVELAEKTIDYYTQVIGRFEEMLAKAGK